MNKADNSSQTGQNELVLVLDDEPLLLEALQASIESIGTKCVTASSIDEAVSILHREGDNIFLVFLDWRLIEEDGPKTGADFLKICRQLRPLLPVVVMTGLLKTVWDVESDALQSEADGFFEKPLRASVVHGYVKRWIQRRRAVPRVFWPETETQVRPLEEIERTYVGRAVEVCRGIASLAAKKLEISRQTVAKILDGGSRRPDKSE